MAGLAFVKLIMSSVCQARVFFDFKRTPTYASGMNMQTSPNTVQFQIEQRLRTMRALWGALLGSIGVYYMISLYVGQPANTDRNNMLSLALLVVALTVIPLSIVIKRRLLNESVAQQQPQLVQQAYLVAWVINEVAALLGLLDFFTTGHRHYYILFIVAVLGHLLHIPRRQHVIDACFRSPTL